MIPFSKQRGGAGGRAEGRPSAMGIWVIHSAPFINIIMEETEGSEGRGRRGDGEVVKTNI